MSPGDRERDPVPGAPPKDSSRCQATRYAESNPCPRPKMRDLSLEVAELLHNMPGDGAAQSERDAWTLRKELLLLEIEAATR
jgi:hypothetical protein